MKSIPTIYEDERLLVLDKPAGLMVHGDGKTAAATLADLVLREYPGMKDVGEPLRIGGKTVYRPGIVHRLDKDTSGVIALAKDAETFSFLKKKFQAREVGKTYLAIVHGRMEEKEGVIDRPLARSAGDFRKYSAHATARGERRAAVTAYRVLGYLTENDREFTVVEAYPKTGRTHQIRAHFHFIHHPVVGDALYAGKLGSALGMERLALHARRLEFTMRSGEKMRFEAPVPEDLARATAGLGRLVEGPSA
ncbi:MAG: RluA family pseudouridine synthase [bacterium]|nr:RluA family pseudouridine synthase [bacterium]